MSRQATVSSTPLTGAVTARRAIADVRRWLGEMWASLCRTLALWRHRARTRAELRSIPRHQLHDLPFDTAVTLNEQNKPFWKQ
ncbi:MAG TPA: hypothetical protein VKX28_24940 [Xanthobacteraceae bacterium]|jgi:uncharacterized protein YjiS (DUF1127 family)|nr:hypothetical protein [Xanthobacteraceae bacterium]